VLSSFGLSIKDDYVDLPSLYLIPKLRKCPYKEWYIARSAKCSTTSLSKILTAVLSTVKVGLTVIPPVHVMASNISKDLVESLSSLSLYPPLPGVLSHFCGGGIAYLKNLDSYAGWSFILLVGPP